MHRDNKYDCGSTNITGQTEKIYLYNMTCYNFCHPGNVAGSVYISGTTCGFGVGAFYLTSGQCICLDVDESYITCDSPVLSGSCVPPTPTPTQTMTPTPTPTQTTTPTPSITPTMTQTPSSTPCPLDCCFSAITNPIWTGGTNENTISEIKPFSDGSLYLHNNQPGGFNGVALIQGWEMRIPSCGVPTADVDLFTPLCFSGINVTFSSLGTYQPQTTGGYIFINRSTSIFKYNDFNTRSTTFNEARISGSTNQGIMGIYVNNADEIYVMGILPNGIRNCSGLTSYQTFNTNIFRLKPNGDIDTSYSGITLDSPTYLEREPAITTEKDPNGYVLVLRQSGFTGNTQWRGVLRLKDDGLPDANFNNNLFSAVTLSSINGAYCQTDGKYMVFGSFQDIAGSGKSRVVRLNSDGTLDTTFTFTGTSAVRDLEQDIYGDYHLILATQYIKLNNSGTTLFTKSTTGGILSCLAVVNCSVYLGTNNSTIIDGQTGSVIKYDLFGNTNMCILPTPTPTRTPTQTPSPTRTPSATPTQTATNTQTPSPSITPSVTPTNTQTPSVTPTNTQTPSVTPTNTQTPSVTATQTQTPSVTATQTQTSTPSQTATNTPTPSTTPPSCVCYYFQNEDSTQSSIFWTPCGSETETSEVLGAGQAVRKCVNSSATAPSYTGGVTTIAPCSSVTTCSDDNDCSGCT